MNSNLRVNCGIDRPKNSQGKNYSPTTLRWFDRFGGIDPIAYKIKVGHPFWSLRDIHRLVAFIGHKQDARANHQDDHYLDYAAE